MDPFLYRTLGARYNNIRLLRLLPGAGDDQIRCEVFHYQLRHERAFGLYEALSYVWGLSDAASNPTILLRYDDETPGLWHNHKVTKNLSFALSRLRDPDLPRILWIGESSVPLFLLSRGIKLSLDSPRCHLYQSGRHRRTCITGSHHGANIRLCSLCSCMAG